MLSYDKEEVKRHINIEAYYRTEFGDFKIDSKGNTKVLCCFHQEKTPSLSLNRNTGAYHCFGCGAKGGDVFAFYQQKHNLTEKDFPKILKYFADLTGILPKSNGTAKKDSALSKDETLYTSEQIKAYRPGGRVFDRYHFYIAGDPQYIKVIYKKSNDPADKTAMFYTLVDGNKKLYTSGRKSKPALFNQELLLKQGLDKPVVWTEGEKDAENVTKKWGCLPLPLAAQTPLYRRWYNTLKIGLFIFSMIMIRPEKRTRKRLRRDFKGQQKK